MAEGVGCHCSRCDSAAALQTETRSRWRLERRAPVWRETSQRVPAALSPCARRARDGGARIQSAQALLMACTGGSLRGTYNTCSSDCRIRPRSRWAEAVASLVGGGEINIERAPAGAAAPLQAQPEGRSSFNFPSRRPRPTPSFAPLPTLSDSKLGRLISKRRR